jgi:tetratricopeptide (TPR) repeat protein
VARRDQGLPIEEPVGGAGAIAAWRREASPIYQALFLTALLVLAFSFVAGLVEGVRLFGLPPIQGNAAILGQALFERGDYAAAFEEYRLAGVIDPENYGVAPRLSFSPAPAAPARVERLQQEAREQPGSAAAHLALGRALVVQGDLAEGLQSLERARDLDARQPELAAALGRAYLEAGRWVESERALREALAADPHPELHDLLGFALHEQGKREEAAQEFERARALRAQTAEQAR